ncbi:cytochrome P450 2J2-like [Heptranchias perlo]|uniref:cytochrome P450 2J2-like n=1 Tax=Heptranchias perlo TaxID=212740 RepID=UPI00355AB3FB
MCSLIVLVFLFVFLLVADTLYTRVPKNFPPGPVALPFIGNAFQLNIKEPHIQFCKFAEKYGDIFSLRLGSSNFVTLNGFKVFKEAVVHQTDAFAGPISDPLVNELLKGHGIQCSNGHVWKEQRKFAVTTLRNFGVGQKSLEERILEEIKHLHNAFEEEKGEYLRQPFNPHYKISNAVTNIICSIVFGERYEYNDTSLQELLHSLNKIEHACFLLQLYILFPTIMKHLPGPHNNIFVLWEKILEYLREKIQKHRDTWNPTEPRDFIDCFMSEMEKGTPNSSFHEENLLHSTVDLFLAGTETTSTTLRWALLYMAAYPDIQEKIHAEIESVIGLSRQPMVDDKPNLPYTNAVIHEIQRKSNIVPLNLTRETTRDTTIGRYLIPKVIGTEILDAKASFETNKSELAVPQAPTTLLGSAVAYPTVLKVTQVAVEEARSGRKRNCMGEMLARMELFLFFTSFLQKFKFQVPEGVEISLDGRMGMTLAPLPYRICAIPH